MILALLLQITPVAPIPKGTGLPPPSSDTAAVMAPIDATLAAIGARDGAAVLAQTRPEGGVTVVADATPPRHLSWSAFAAALKPGPERYAERLSDPAIEIDGDIAMAWSPYVFTIDGRVDHCGVDHFDLVREAARWRILNVTYSRRTTGCGA